MEDNVRTISDNQFHIETQEKINRNKRLIKYAQDRFEIGSFLYLTKPAHDQASEERGEEFHRGPWQVDKLGVTQDVFSNPYMRLFDPAGPSWKMESYIDYDNQVEEWLTSDEYHIEKIKEYLWEKSLYEVGNSVFLNKDGIQDKSKIDKYDNWVEKPHLWVPDVEDEIYVKRSSHHILRKSYTISCPPFVRCLVLDIEKMPHNDPEIWNPHNTPTLRVKPIQFDSEIDPISGIEPILCYPATPKDKEKRPRGV